MNLREVLHIVGALIVWTAVAMLPPTVIGFTEGLAVHWALTFGVTASLGAVMWFITPRDVSINRREGIAIVGLGWLAVVAVGSLPFALTGVAPTVASAVFESVSGFTTTGATVAKNSDARSRAVSVTPLTSWGSSWTSSMPRPSTTRSGQ